MTFSKENHVEDTEQINVPEQPINPESMERDSFIDPEVADNFNAQTREKALISEEIDAALEQVDALDDKQPEEAMANDGMVRKLAEKLQNSKVAKYAVLGASFFFASPAAAAELSKDQLFLNSLSSIQKERIVSATGKLDGNLGKLNGATLLQERQTSPGNLRLSNLRMGKSFTERARLGTGQPIKLNHEFINRSSYYNLQNNMLQNSAIRTQFNNINIHPDANIGNYDVDSSSRLTVGPNSSVDGSISVDSDSEVNIGGYQER